ncbi:hypothetical protein [Marinifilum sp. N1E240]|uniref:hypothetical protein n=1 Tax=Marinifilum sp. N1E240 TaxID=2608082 RepID=UPI00186BB206|nr:hypothetical protein [Marinifilum sp. N1E240]
MKNLERLNGAKSLDKKEQQNIKGGQWTEDPKCIDDQSCPEGQGCVIDLGICLPIPV